MTAPAQAVQAINQALDALEIVLEPILDNALHETLEGRDNLEQAKLCAMIPYVVNQLITTYLRTRGVDPETHHVAGEVERIKSYFYKIARTEQPNKPIQRQSDQNLQLDKEAANRFIKAALSEATRAEKQELDRLGISGPTMASQETWTPHTHNADNQNPPGERSTHIRFSRATEEDETDDSASSSSEEEPAKPSVVVASKKDRRRLAIDPFTGYTEPLSKKTKGKAKARASASKTAASAQSSSMEVTEEQAANLGEGTPNHSVGPNEAGKSKNARKKSKRKQRSTSSG